MMARRTNRMAVEESVPGLKATPHMVELDDAELLGFEWLEPERGGEATSKQSLGLAFNKRGGEGTPDERVEGPSRR